MKKKANSRMNHRHPNAMPPRPRQGKNLAVGGGRSGPTASGWRAAKAVAAEGNAGRSGVGTTMGKRPPAPPTSRRRGVSRAARLGGAAVLALVLGCSAAVALAASAQERPGDEGTAPSQDDQASQSGQQDAHPDDDDAKAPAEVFLPTEEISEDYAVSFPVDI